MAKIDIVYPANEHVPTPSVETIEVRFWDLGGKPEQVFYIGSGLNFSASANIWTEIIYTVQGAQIFYTRNFLHDAFPASADASRKRLGEVIEKKEGVFGFVDMMPETSILLKVEKKSYKSFDGNDVEFTQTELKLSADTGPVFGFSAPGERSIDIRINGIELDDAAQFLNDLINELEDVRNGKHPNPACFPPGSSEWGFIWQLNREAYKHISTDYHEQYFENPVLKRAFDYFLEQLPPGGRVLDAGCGHGDPVIGYVLGKDFQVTGTDFSPEMLAKARVNFPQAEFIQKATTRLGFDSLFDGACSFSSLLYMDPIDFYNSLYQLHGALKPGGLLFLHGYEVSASWRGSPYFYRLDQYMWSWHYGMEEVAIRLQEHGFFEVLGLERVSVDSEGEKKYAEAVEADKLARIEYERDQSHKEGFRLPYMSSLPERPPYGYVVMARCKKG